MHFPTWMNSFPKISFYSFLFYSFGEMMWPMVKRLLLFDSNKSCPAFLFRNWEKRHLFLVIFSLGSSEEILNNKKVLFHIPILIWYTSHFLTQEKCKRFHIAIAFWGKALLVLSIDENMSHRENYCFTQTLSLETGLEPWFTPFLTHIFPPLKCFQYPLCMTLMEMCVWCEYYQYVCF